MNRLSSLLAFFLTAASMAAAADFPPRREWNVDGVVREALVHVPASAATEPAPVVFAFHGHGGTMSNAARMFGFHTRWPEAIVVYMQGLKTPGRLTDPNGNAPGWQRTLGDQDDRDLKFFDAVLAALKQDYRVDSKRIYSTGHSNGGGFTYLLLAARGNLFAAFAPSAAAYFPALQTKAPPYVPRPVLHLAGQNDPLVKFEWQEQTMEAVRKLNQCGEGKPWLNEKNCTIYESKLNAPVVTFIHPGTHAFPAGGAAIIFKYFKQHSQP
jgi:polyhydroxybutyrate depolymerase